MKFLDFIINTIAIIAIIIIVLLLKEKLNIHEDMQIR